MKKYCCREFQLMYKSQLKVSVSEQHLCSCVCDLLPVRRSHPDVPTQPPGPSTVGVSGQHALSTAQVVGAVGHRNLHQPRVGRHKQQTLQRRRKTSFKYLIRRVNAGQKRTPAFGYKFLMNPIRASCKNSYLR